MLVSENVFPASCFMCMHMAFQRMEGPVLMLVQQAPSALTKKTYIFAW